MATLICVFLIVIWVRGCEAQDEMCFMPQLQESGVIKPSAHLPFCPYPAPTLGKFNVDITVRKVDDIVQRCGHVRYGGSWAPEVCVAWQRTAILVPYRNRTEDLGLLLQNLHRFLQHQLLNYTIFIIEQADDKHFNKGAIMNAGWLEVSNQGTYDCIILQDVDKFPEDTRNAHMCLDGPLHLISKRRFVNGDAVREYRKHSYRKYFGGVLSISAEHFKLINGFSNNFWAWGSEDDDLYERMVHHNLTTHRAGDMVGGFAESYLPRGPFNPMRKLLMKDGPNRYKTDGLNSVDYRLQGFAQTQLYTHLSIHILHDDPLKDITEESTKN